MVNSSSDHYSGLAGAVVNLSPSTAEARRRLYDAAREDLLRRMRSANPPTPLPEVIAEQSELEDAIRRIEIQCLRGELFTTPEDAPAPGSGGFSPQPPFEVQRKATRKRHASGRPWLFGIGAVAGAVVLAMLLVVGMSRIGFDRTRPAEMASPALPRIEQRAIAQSSDQSGGGRGETAAQSQTAPAVPADDPAPDTEVLRALESGNARLHSGDYDGAVSAFDQAIRLAPDQALAYGGRAHAYWAKGNSEQAVRDYGRAILLDPDRAQVWIDRAMVLNRIGEYQRAVFDLNQALRVDPRSAPAWHERCFALGLLERFQEALADCNEALRLDPGNARALDTRGLVYLRMGDFGRAIADYEAALRKDPAHAEALYGRGLARIGRGDRSGGEEDLNAASTLRPNLDATFARYGLR